MERELLGRMAPESNHFERWCPGEFLHPFTAKKRTPLRIGHTSYDVEELVDHAVPPVVLFKTRFPFESKLAPEIETPFVPVAQVGVPPSV